MIAHRILKYVVILGSLMAFLGLSESFAQNQGYPQHHKVGDILEVSLMGLRESANQVARRNEWLMAEIEIFRENIRLLEADLQYLGDNNTR